MDADERRHSLIIEAFRRFGRLKPYLPRMDVPQGELFLLHSIAAASRQGGGNGVRIGAISGWTRMSMPAVSQMLNSLEGKGLVCRSMDQEDRRSVLVNVTEKGTELMELSIKKVEELSRKVEERLGKEDTDRFIEISGRLFAIMEDIRKNEIETGKEAEKRI